MPANHQRLRVLHLLLAMTLCAMVATARMAWTDWQTVPQEYHALLRVGHLLMAIFIGTAIVVVLELAWRRLRKPSSNPAAPGQVLAVWIATMGALQGLAHVVSVEFGFMLASPNSDYYAWHLKGTVIHFAGAVCSFTFAIRMQASWTWRLLLILPGAGFVLFCPLYLVPLTGIMLGGYQQVALACGQMLVGSSVLLTLLIALRRKGSTLGNDDWTHWWGVAIYLGLSITMLGEATYVLFLETS